MSSFTLKTSIPAIAALAAIVLFAPGAGSQTIATRPGDLAVTGFSGTLSSETLAPGVDPTDRTFIDPGAAALRIFDGSNLGATRGELITAPIRLEVAARDIGQVFGLAFDEGPGGSPPNLYVAASSAFGLRIVSEKAEADGKPARLKEGALDARFMEGQFGALSGDSPGAIYKIDGATGAVSYYADTAFTGVPNSGPGLGALAYDTHSRTLYASDLDTGLIHRFGLDYNAADLSQFDHGIAGRRAGGLDPIPDDAKTGDLLSPNFKADDPATWGFTQPERRINALAVHNGRLYYAVTAGPEIWSVGLNGGEFMGDARREVSVKAAQPFPITGIGFDGKGRMIASQRGSLKSPYDYGSFVDTGPAQVLRYAPEEPDDPNTPDRWRPDQDYAVGQHEDGRMATGGVSLQYGYRADGSIDLGVCDGSVALTGDSLRGGTAVHGVEFNALDALRPQSGESPAPIAVLAFDARQDEPDLRGHVGNVAAFRRCEGEGAPGFPPIADGGGTGFPPVADGAGGGGAGFPPVEDGGADGGAGFPPVEDGGAGAGLPPVGPGASNLSVTKTQDCKLVGADKAECEYTVQLTNTTQVPFLSDGLTFADRFSTAPQSFTTEGFGTPNTTPGGFETNPGRFGFTSFPPGPAGFNSKIKATFAVPAGGLVVENCITLDTVAGGTPLTPKFVLPEPPPPQPDLPATTTNGLDRAVAITGTPQCTVRGALRDCTWTVTVSNPGTVPTSMSFTVATSIPNLGMGSTAGVGVSRKSDTTTQFANSDPMPPKAARSFTVKATFPAKPPAPITATASVASQFIADVNAANNTASAQAGTAAPEVLPSPGVTSADANPGDNRSCIKWDSKIPNNQGTPTNDPTVPSPATPPPVPSQAGALSLVKTGGSCRNNRFCDFTITVSNTSGTPFTGKVEFDDGITGDGAIFGATAITPAPAAPWSCAKAPQGFKCTADLTIPANSVAPPLKLTFDLGPGIGTVKEVRNCATLAGAQTPSCVTIPMQAQPGPGAPTPQAGPLTIEKQATATQCSSAGGGCDFKIVITNSGTTEFNGPIEVIDTVTGDGVVWSTTTLTGGQSQPGPIFCEKQNHIFVCKSPPTVPTKIAPGGTIELNLSFRLGPGTATREIRNCARLAGQDAESCATILLVAGIKLRVTKIASGPCNPDCTFTIGVQNVGDTPYKGPLSITDTFSGKSDALIKSVAPTPWLCTDKGATFTCVIQEVTLLSTASTFVVLTITPLKRAASYTNCADLAVPLDKADTPSPNRCVTVEDAVVAKGDVGPAPKKVAPNIAVEKRALLDPPHCPLRGPCPFEVIVHNKGDGDYFGDLNIFDNIQTSGHTIRAFSTSPKNIDCTIRDFRDSMDCKFKNTTLKAGGTMSFAVTLDIDFAPGAGEVFKNCARYVKSLSDDNDPATVSGDNEGCATVTLDPFALRIAKSGSQSCVPGGNCSFNLEIYNPGPIPHNAPVTVVDGLSGLAGVPILSIVPAAGAKPFPCKPAPTEIPFSCTGHMKLEVDEHHKYVMTVRIPPDAPSAGSFRNCAVIADASGVTGNARTEEQARVEATAAGGGRQEAIDCHAVALSPPVGPKSVPASCTGGMFLTREGLCACPPGLRWSGRRCVAERAEQPPPRRPDGSAGSDRVEQPPERCPSSRPVGRPPNCCPRGTVYLGGACRKPTEPPPVTCPSDRPVGKPPNCCPTGTRFLGGACRRPSGERECPPGTRGNYPNCQCPLGMSGTPPNCCPPGTRFLDGKCQRPQREVPRTCPADRPVGTPPNCCPLGTHFQDGQCLRRRVPCPSPATGFRPACQCPTGQRWTGARCVRESPTQPESQPKACTGGMVGTPPSCRCPQGTRYSPTMSRRTKGRMKCISVRPGGPIVR